MKTLALILLFLFVAAFSPASTVKESMSLYGYLLDYFQGSFDVHTKESSYGNTLLVRIKADFNPEERLRFHAEAAYYGRLGNQNLYAIYDKIGLNPERQEQFPFNDFITQVLVDHAWGLANLGAVDLQFGKVPIAWGSGYVFNPTAKVAPTAIFDEVTEETPGTFAIVPSYYTARSVTFTGYLAFQDRSHKTFSPSGDGEWRNVPFGFKVQVITGSFDLSAGVIKEVFYGQTGYERDFYLGFDLDGGFDGCGLYAESALRLPEMGFRDLYDIEESLEIVAGCHFPIPKLGTDMRLEYFHQGRGADKKSDYDLSRVISGEQLVLGENYLFLYFERYLTDYIRISTGSLLNLGDWSLVLYPECCWDVLGNLQIYFGASLFAGGRGNEFSGPHTVEGDQEFDIIESFSLFTRIKLSF